MNPNQSTNERKASTSSNTESATNRATTLSFPDIIGQESLKRALLVLAVDDAIDGVLLTGEKGTAKSTAVRALVGLLPAQRAIADCPYGCPPDDPRRQCSNCRDSDDPPVESRRVPLVTLPLGATRDRVVGTLSVADALSGAAEFSPGLLARANRGILYVDEVNLLDDHLVDVLLDAAANGVNRVERDGMSVSHPADITLVGTMNPEEGALRPQLRDRFSIQATVTGCEDPRDRVAIIDRVLSHSTGADSNRADSSAPATDGETVESLSRTVNEARNRLSGVDLPDQFAHQIATLCLDAGVDGHRGDIATARTAMALAALDGRSRVIESDLQEAARFALPHRLEGTPFEDPPDIEEILHAHFENEDDADGDPETDPSDGTDGPGGPTDGSDRDRDVDEGRSGGDESGSGTGEDQPSEGKRTEQLEESSAKSEGPAGAEVGSESTENESHDSADSTDSATKTATPDRPTLDRPPLNDDTSDNDRDGTPVLGRGQDSSESRAEGTEDVDRSGSADGTADSIEPDSGDPDSDVQTPLTPGHRATGASSVSDDFELPELGSDSGTGSRDGTTATADGRGSRVRTESADSDDPIDAAASVRAAAARGGSRVDSQDLRRTVRTETASATIVFTVDASASMRPAMRAAKGVVLDLLQESYERRDRVAFVAFAGDDALTLLPPTTDVSLAARHLKDLPTSDRTPLPAGLEQAGSVLERAESDAAVVILVTDGRANVADGSPTEATRRAARGLRKAGAHVVVVDASADERPNLVGLIAAESGGQSIPLSELTAERVRTAVATATETD